MGSGSTAQAFLDPDEVSISSSDGVIVVSYFLPLIVTRAPSSSPKGGGGGGGGSNTQGEEEDSHDWIISWDTENLLSLRTRLRVTWVGTVRLPEEAGGRLNREEQESLARALRRFDCVPVFIDPDQHEKFYKTFCKGTLWPVFHHILDVYGPKVKTDPSTHPPTHPPTHLLMYIREQTQPPTHPPTYLCISEKRPTHPPIAAAHSNRRLLLHPA